MTDVTRIDWVDDQQRTDIQPGVTMNWKLKAWIQNSVALMPDRLSRPAYYFLQSKFGGLRDFNPTDRLLIAKKLVDKIVATGRSLDGKTVVEVGTGWSLTVPIALWLRGADRIITVDLNPYLREEKVKGVMSWITRHRDEVVALFGAHAESATFHSRLDRLATLSGSFEDILDAMGMEYRAPADASRMDDLAAGSVDYQISNNVFEHIPLEVLLGILREGKRILRPGGVMIHAIDHSDHFSHSDQQISYINFLQFSQEQWDRYADNRFAYYDNLRAAECADMFSAAGLVIVDHEKNINQRAMKALQAGFPLHQAFADIPLSC